MSRDRVNLVAPLAAATARAVQRSAREVDWLVRQPWRCVKQAVTLGRTTSKRPLTQAMPVMQPGRDGLALGRLLHSTCAEIAALERERPRSEDLAPPDPAVLALYRHAIIAFTSYLDGNHTYRDAIIVGHRAWRGPDERPQQALLAAALRRAATAAYDALGGDGTEEEASHLVELRRLFLALSPREKLHREVMRVFPDLWSGCDDDTMSVATSVIANGFAHWLAATRTRSAAPLRRAARVQSLIGASLGVVLSERPGLMGTTAAMVGISGKLEVHYVLAHSHGIPPRLVQAARRMRDGALCSAQLAVYGKPACNSAAA